MSEEPSAQPRWDGPAPQRVYANAVKINGGPFDVMLIFGLLQPEVAAERPPAVEEAVRVSMSWGHAKAMIPLLARMVAEYESKYGEVPAPGFEDNWRG